MTSTLAKLYSAADYPAHVWRMPQSDDRTLADYNRQLQETFLAALQEFATLFSAEDYPKD